VHAPNSVLALPPQWSLHYGNGKSLAFVIPDDRWPGMYRLHWPDGQVSDIVNLTRAKDAAVTICERGPPRRAVRLFRWKIDRRESPADGAYARLIRGRAA
jgi:hypothetical protein